MEERKPKGGLCLYASVRIQVAAVLTHTAHCASRCPLAMPNILRRLAFRCN